MQKVLAVVNDKGGAGKTTISVNLGGALADLGLRVLFIDTDTQQSTTRFLGTDTQSGKGLVEFIQYADREAICSTSMSGHLRGSIDIIVNNDPRNGLRLFLNESIAHSFNFANSIKEIQDDYDVIIIDTKGVDGWAEIKETAILAADLLLVPTRPAGLDASEMGQNIKAFERIITPCKSMNLTRTEPVMKILINAAKRTNLSKDVSRYLRQEFNPSDMPVSVLSTEVPSLDVYESFFTYGDFVHKLDKRPRNGINPAPSAADTMLALAHELFPNLIDLTFSGEV